MVVELGKKEDDNNDENMWVNQGMDGNWGADYNGNANTIDLNQLRELVALFPSDKWHTLSLLLEFLAQILSVNSGNDASQDAFAQVFAPVICRPPGSAYMSLRHVKDLVPIQRVVLSLMVNYSFLDQKDIKSQKIDKPVHTPVKSRENEKGFRQKRKSVVDMAIIQNMIVDCVGQLFQNRNEMEVEGSQKSEASSIISIRGGSNRADFFNRLPSQMVYFGSNNSTKKTSFFESDDEDAAGHLIYSESMSVLSPTASYHPYGTNVGNGRERKRLQQACKALRAQIHQFEEVFAAENGHVPRGRERSVLSSTYAQLKQWKRVINLGAAIQIQAFIRGSLVRIRHTNIGRVAPQYLSLKPQNYNAPNPGIARTTPPVITRESQSTLEARLAAYIEEKKIIKNKLKEFDQMFLDKEGRMPNKSDKEPMRSLYDRYNTLKNTIKDTEEAVSNAQRASSSKVKNLHPPPTPPTLPRLTHSPVSSHRDSSSNIIGSGDSNSFRGVVHAHEPQVSVEQLKKEKKELHNMLKAYEQDFKAKYGREVSSPADIAPVEAEYQRYKDIKKRLSKIITNPSTAKRG